MVVVKIKCFYSTWKKVTHTPYATTTNQESKEDPIRGISGQVNQMPCANFSSDSNKSVVGKNVWANQKNRNIYWKVFGCDNIWSHFLVCTFETHTEVFPDEIKYGTYDVLENNPEACRRKVAWGGTDEMKVVTLRSGSGAHEVRHYTRLYFCALNVL